MPAAVLSRGEPELSVRDGQVLAPRLARIRPPAGPEPGAELPWGDGTVLITRGTGGLAALVARHLAARHLAARHDVRDCCSCPTAARLRRERPSWWPTWPGWAPTWLLRARGEVSPLFRALIGPRGSGR